MTPVHCFVKKRAFLQSCNDSEGPRSSMLARVGGAYEQLSGPNYQFLVDVRVCATGRARITKRPCEVSDVRRFDALEEP